MRERCVASYGYGQAVLLTRETLNPKIKMKAWCQEDSKREMNHLTVGPPPALSVHLHGSQHILCAPTTNTTTERALESYAL